MTAVDLLKRQLDSVLIINSISGMLSSSEDDGDSYSSDGEEGSLVIDATAQPNEVNQNGHQVDPMRYSNSPDAERH